MSSSVSLTADDCLAAILAAELIILFFVISSQNPRTDPGFLALRLYCLGMVFLLFFKKTLICQDKDYIRLQMDVERGKAILKEACMNYTEFSQLVGVKPITARLAFSNKRLSKKMVALLLDMESKQKDEEEKKERVLVKEGMIKQSMDQVLTAKVYLLPKNPYLRFIEFPDGTHGKFRAKPGRFALGSVVKVKRESGDMYTLEGNYDRKDRLT